MLTSQINHSRFALALLKQQEQPSSKDITEVTNPHCEPSYQFQRRIGQTQATPDDSGVSDGSLYARLDVERYEVPQGTVDAFFLTQSREKRYQAAAADLVAAGLPEGQLRELLVIA